MSACARLLANWLPAYAFLYIAFLYLPVLLLPCSRSTIRHADASR
jgi:spermidine/putrescine transport system permease protein